MRIAILIVLDNEQTLSSTNEENNLVFPYSKDNITMATQTAEQKAAAAAKRAEKKAAAAAEANKRNVIEFNYEKEAAFARNKAAVKAEYETGSNDKRVIQWAIGKITIEELNGKKVYAGMLATNTKYLGTKKGYMSRGAFAPIPFSYDPATKTVYAEKGETQERRKCLAQHVCQLMEKYIAGQNRINGAKDIEQLKAVRGYNQYLRDPQFTPFIKKYHGIVTMTPKTQEKVEKAETASLPDFD